MYFVIKLFATLILIALVLSSVFTFELFTMLGIRHLFSWTWEIAFVQFSVMVTSFIGIIYLWSQQRVWKWILITTVFNAYYSIITTPVFTSGGWIYSAPDREDVAVWFIFVYALTYGFFLLWQLLHFCIGRKLAFLNINKKINFYVVSISISFLFLSIFFLGQRSPMYGQIFSRQESLESTLYTTFFIGGLLILLVYQFIHISFLRIQYLGYSKYWLGVLIVPLLLLSVVDFGGYLFFIMSLPAYLVEMFILGLLSKKKLKK